LCVSSLVKFLLVVIHGDAVGQPRDDEQGTAYRRDAQHPGVELLVHASVFDLLKYFYRAVDYRNERECL